MNVLKSILKPRVGPDPQRGTCCAVIVAAGTASRMKGIDKILVPLGDRPLLMHTLIPFQNSDCIDSIVIVTREDLIDPILDLTRQWEISKVYAVVPGGATRTDSVLAGLSVMPKDTAFAAIHDGARPFLPVSVLEDTVHRARMQNAAAPAIPVKDTIKRAANDTVEETLKREELYAVQTPQVFASELIRAALIKAKEDGALLTDDCSAVERIGFPVRLTQGSEDNFKVTTPADMRIGKAILAERETI